MQLGKGTERGLEARMQADESSWAAKEVMQQVEDSKAERRQGMRSATEGDGESPPSVHFCSHRSARVARFGSHE